MRPSSANKTKKLSSYNITIIICLIIAICILVLFIGTTFDKFTSLQGTISEKVLMSKIDKELKSIDILTYGLEESSTVKSSNQTHVPQLSENAYVTLISGLDTNYYYRGYLYNALIMKKALKTLGSTADFIAMIGYSDSNTEPYESDMELLRRNGIITYALPRLLKTRHKLGFAEMALLKITPYSFIQYKRIQFLDGDVMPTRNMDCFFNLDYNTFTIGAVSPLNSGWFLGIPDIKAYNYMKERALWRLGRDWDSSNGWKEKMPKSLTFRGGKPCTKWEFNGADMDQGLFTHYFIINHGNAILIDTELHKARVFTYGIINKKDEIVTMNTILKCCDGVIPTSHFIHFTGRSKPWLNRDLGNSPGRNIVIWRTYLDSLELPTVNSSTIVRMNFKPPLGYFNANFPKGGYH